MHEDSFLQRREIERMAFVAEVELVELRSDARLAARISEISGRGCYIDTLNPFPISSELRIRVRHAGVSVEVPGKVIYTHTGFGMGVLFGEMTADQRTVLDAWLGEASPKTD